jgi:hypothetical protein
MNVLDNETNNNSIRDNLYFKKKADKIIGQIFAGQMSS